MTKIVLEQLVWDDWNKKHIKKHQVSVKEVEEAISRILTHRAGYSGKIILIGRSGKRILAMIVAKEQGNKYYVVTVRDADKKERRLVYEKEKQDS